MSREYIKAGLFAFELVKSVSESAFKGKWRTKILRHYKSVIKDSGFDKKIGDAIFQIIDQNDKLVCQCFEELDNATHIPNTDLAYFALNAVPTYFPEGYTPVGFLSFCSMLVGVALCYLESYWYEGILEAAAGVIQAVLTYFILISDFDMVKDVPELIRVSKHCYRKLKPRKK